MRLRACILAIAVVTPLRAFAQTPPAPPPEAAPPAPPPPAVVAAPADATPPPPPPAAVAAAPMAPAAPAAGPKFTFGGLADAYWLYSRSILFNVIPLVHTGARANLKVSDQLSLQLSLVNGWNNDPDNNAWKTVGLNAAITINPMISIIPTVYIGKEATQPPGASTPGDTRVLVDVVVPVTLSDKIGLNFNVDFIDA